jgi:cyclopropane fatty-acyl-phospholipid synthase-like methyltransferase
MLLRRLGRGRRRSGQAARNSDPRAVRDRILGPCSTPRDRAAQAAPRQRTSDSRNNIRHHYDLGNDFYRLWLDRQLSYTCAYFPSPEITLEEAQIAKMDHVCRKLRLQPGEKVVEAGCGWGALALHMATRYGVHVKAFNISREQSPTRPSARARWTQTGGSSSSRTITAISAGASTRSSR